MIWEDGICRKFQVGFDNLFDLILYVPVINLSVWDGSSWVEPVLRINAYCSRTQSSDASVARTCSPSDSSQALYH